MLMPSTIVFMTGTEVPNRSTKSPERRRHQKKRSFRRGQKWRTGVEGRISVLKRRHGLNRCRYRGDAGMQRWVGLGVIRGQSNQYRSVPGGKRHGIEVKMWATARPKREGRKMRERPEPACSVPDLAHLQQAFLRRKVAKMPLGGSVTLTPAGPADILRPTVAV